MFNLNLVNEPLNEHGAIIVGQNLSDHIGQCPERKGPAGLNNLPKIPKSVVKKLKTLGCILKNSFLFDYSIFSL